ncbi:MAG: hypothetical protein IME99_08345 [Proteobacteria bacterium]|nr:hypothetical protein [Pseudomonadota bacterium]
MTKIGKVVRGLSVGLLSLALFSVAVPSADASGITVYKEGDKYLKFGGRVILQYQSTDVENGTDTDVLQFRYLRPYIEGSLYKDWTGKIQLEMGKASGDNEVAVKEAFMRYTGYGSTVVTIGQIDFPFSRENLTSSKKQHLAERTFTGSHDYGSLDKQLGLFVSGANGDKTVTWAAGATSTSIDPDSSKLDFDTPVNKNADFNEGWTVGGRVDYHPFGYLPFGQGNIVTESLKATVGVGAFVWNNDSDNNTYTTNGVDSGAGTADVDTVTGLEVSAGVRVQGASLDTQYNQFSAKTVDKAVTSGIYLNGETKLKSLSVEGGYMVVPERVEVVAGYQSLDADNYATKWTRTSVGVNYYIHGHDLKIQGTYRMGSDVDGVQDSNKNELFLRTQYVF